MATIEDYTSGNVCEKIKLAFSVFETADKTLCNTDIGKTLLSAIKEYEPRKLSIKEAIHMVENAEQCAIGDRVCRAIFTDTPLTETVFLDELAQGMVAAGKAKTATKMEAIESINKYVRKPIMVSKVSGKHSEICFSWPKMCVYWNAEKLGLKCIIRK